MLLSSHISRSQLKFCTEVQTQVIDKLGSFYRTLDSKRKGLLVQVSKARATRSELITSRRKKST